MKPLYLLPILLLLFACAKEEDYTNMPVYLPGDISSGHISMKKNNRDMMASAFATKCFRDESNLALRIEAFDNEGTLMEQYILECMQMNLNDQMLCKNQDMNCLVWMHYETLIEDQSIDSYILDTSKKNFIQITEIDTTSGWISGKMEMHFDRDKSKPKGNANNPEKVSFTEGNFSIKLPD